MHPRVLIAGQTTRFMLTRLALIGIALSLPFALQAGDEPRGPLGAVRGPAVLHDAAGSAALVAKPVVRTLQRAFDRTEAPTNLGLMPTLAVLAAAVLAVVLGSGPSIPRRTTGGSRSSTRAPPMLG